MNDKNSRSLKWLILRWAPRVWSVLLAVFALVIIFSPDPYATGEPIPATDLVLLGLWGASIVGLLIGWFNERLGAFLAIGAMIIREALFIIVEGRWLANFLLIWLVILPPAVMYLLAWRFKQKQTAVNP